MDDNKRTEPDIPMHAIVISVTAAIVLSTATPADARPRFRLKSPSPSPATSAPAGASSVSVRPVASPSIAGPAPSARGSGTLEAGSVVPLSVLGGATAVSRATRARGDSAAADTPTGSTNPAPDRITAASEAPASSVARSAPRRKPGCAPGAMFGGGFCEVN